VFGPCSCIISPIGQECLCPQPLHLTPISPIRPRSRSQTLTGAAVDRWPSLRTAPAPMEHRNGTATAPRLCFSDRYRTEARRFDKWSSHASSAFDLRVVLINKSVSPLPLSIRNDSQNRSSCRRHHRHCRRGPRPHHHRRRQRRIDLGRRHHRHHHLYRS
jgi:hypothetical protein